MRHFQEQSTTTESSGPDLGTVHKAMMIFGWLLLSNLGLWCQYFKHSRFAIHLHSLFMVTCILMAWAAGFLAIVVFGLNSMTRLHVGFGLTILTLMFIVALGGVSA